MDKRDELVYGVGITFSNISSNMSKITLKKHHFKPYIQKNFPEPPANGSALWALVVYQLYGPLES